MDYREQAAPPALRGLVECGWSWVAAPLEPALTRNVLPDGAMDLVWTGAALLVAGPDTEPHPFRCLPGSAAAGLRFAPGRLPALLGVPASVVRDQRVPVAEFHPELARRATDRLERGDPAAAVLAELATALPGAGPGPSVAGAVAHLRAGRSAAATADALGWTTRSLHRHCLDWFGYGPAVLRRILRFRTALVLLQAGVPAAEAAARAGYADQPHLSREARTLGGIRPGQVASEAKRSTPVPSGSSTVA